MRQTRVVPGDVLLNITGASIGRVCVVPSDLCPANVNQHVSIIRSDSSFEPAFLAYYISTPEFQKFILDSEAGATRQALTKSLIEDFKIPLPPITEQKRIVAILNEQMAAVEKARTATLAQIEAAKALPAAYLRQVFDSLEDSKYVSYPIGKVAKVQSGYAFKSTWFTSSGIRLLRNANVLQGFISWEDVVYISDSEKDSFSAFELSEGDIVLSLDRPLVNNGLKVSRLSSYDVPSLLLQRVGRFQLNENEIYPSYLYAFLNSPRFIDSISGHDQSIGVPHISPKQVETVKIPLPCLAKQQTLAEEVWGRIGIAKQLQRSLREQLDAIEKLPAALLHKAFNGEL